MAELPVAPSVPTSPRCRASISSRPESAPGSSPGTPPARSLPTGCPACRRGSAPRCTWRVDTSSSLCTRALRRARGARHLHFAAVVLKPKERARMRVHPAPAAGRDEEVGQAPGRCRRTRSGTGRSKSSAGACPRAGARSRGGISHITPRSRTSRLLAHAGPTGASCHPADLTVVLRLGRRRRTGSPIGKWSSSTSFSTTFFQSISSSCVQTSSAAPSGPSCGAQAPPRAAPCARRLEGLRPWSG